MYNAVGLRHRVARVCQWQWRLVTVAGYGLHVGLCVATVVDSTRKQITTMKDKRLFTILKVSGFDLVASSIADRFHIFQLRPGLPHTRPLQAAVLEIFPAGARITHPPICVLVLDRKIATVFVIFLTAAATITTHTTV